MKVDIKGFKAKPNGKETAGIQFRLKTMDMAEYVRPEELSNALYNGHTVVIDNVKICNEEGLYRNIKGNCIGTRYIGIDIDADQRYPIQDIEDTEKLLKEIGIRWSFRYKTFSYNTPEKVNVKDENGKNVKDEDGNIVKVETGRIKKNHRYIIHISELLTPHEALGFYKYIESKFAQNCTPLDDKASDLVRLWFGGTSNESVINTPYDTMTKDEVLIMAANEISNVGNYFNDNFSKRKFTKPRTREVKNSGKLRSIKKMRNVKIAKGYELPNFETDFQFYDFKIKPLHKVDDIELLNFIDESIEEWIDYGYMRNIMLALTIFESVGETQYMNYFIDNLEEEYKDQWSYYVIDARCKQYITREAVEIFNRFMIEMEESEQEGKVLDLINFKFK